MVKGRLGSTDRREKRGHDRGTSLYHLPIVVAPPLLGLYQAARITVVDTEPSSMIFLVNFDSCTIEMKSFKFLAAQWNKR